MLDQTKQAALIDIRSVCRSFPKGSGEQLLVLENVDLTIHAGEIVGLLGRSGSGKSTLTKLVQRLYAPEAGRILVDGIDIGLIDAAQLRRQVGVVLQENFLFNRSVRENIAIADPAAPLQSIVRAARLAGAHDFISELAEGYDTHAAVRRTVTTAGRTVVYSGATMGLIMATLLVFPQYLFRSLGYAGLFAVLTALVGALLTAPAVLRHRRRRHWVMRDFCAPTHAT